MKITAKKSLLFLLLFLGIGALYGGGLLIIDPSGKLLGTPLSMLKPSSFSTFLIPGIILFLVIGVAPCLLTLALIKKHNSNLAERLNCFKDMHWSWSFSIYIAITLIIWIQVQEALINSIGWLHGLYMLWAILIIFIALLPQVRSNYKK